MHTNLDKYKNDLKKLTELGFQLHIAVQKECYSNFEEHLLLSLKTKEAVAQFNEKIISFNDSYQKWYSEAYACIKQILPDRLSDFVKQYEKPKNRKNITYENYTIEDGLVGLRVTRGSYDTVVDKPAMVPKFRIQLEILKSVEQRFESALFDIRQLVQADLFDSELDAAKELLKKGFNRGAGAIAGVVLEKHLKQVCENHNLSITKKNPSISDFNEILKNSSVIETAAWRHIQLLGDLRNLSDHNKEKEPTKEQINDLIDGVVKIVKTLF